MVGLDAPTGALLGVRERDGRPSALAALRGRLGLVALLVTTAAGCWWWTAHRMAGMGGRPGADLGTFGWFVGFWVVMMAAMMLPSVSPTVVLYARMTRARGAGRPLLFTSAYLLVWGAAGAAAYAVVEGGRRAGPAALSWNAGGRWVAGGVLLAAAAYELTPLKNVCLGKCRSPLGFLLSSWRDGRLGAVRMGTRHALWCVGCCWALMGALFALGVMSLVWMAAVAAVITVEKTLPWRRAVLVATTAVLVALAVAVVVAPHRVPGLIVPDGTGAASQMGSMP